MPRSDLSTLSKDDISRLVRVVADMQMVYAETRSPMGRVIGQWHRCQPNVREREQQTSGAGGARASVQ